MTLDDPRFALCVAVLLSANFLGEVQAKHWTPKPSDDLEEVCRKAFSGDSILLGDGDYRGPFRIAGKTLKIAAREGTKPVLRGGSEQRPLAYVYGNGSLELDGVELRTGKSVLAAIYANKAEVTIRNCKAEDVGRFIYARDSDVTVDGCTVEDVKFAGVHVSGEGSLDVRNTSFKNIGQLAVTIDVTGRAVISGGRFVDGEGGILCNDANALTVEKNHFERVGWAVSANEPVAKVTIAGNRIAKTREGAAINIAASGAIRITKNTIVEAPYGIGLQGQWKAPVEIRHNFVIGIEKHALYAEGHAAAKECRVRLYANGLTSHGDAAVFINGKFPVQLEENIVLTRGKTAVHIQHGATARLHHNILYATEYSAYLHEVDARTRLDANVNIARVWPQSGTIFTDAQLRANHIVSEEVRDRLAERVAAVFASEKETTAGDLRAFGKSGKQLFLDSFEQLKKANELASVSCQLKGFDDSRKSVEFEILGADGKIVSSHGGDNPRAWVSPGTYQLRPTSLDRRVRTVTVTASESKTVEFVDPCRAELTLKRYLEGSRNDLHLSVVFKSPERLQRILRDKRRNQAVAMLRPGVGRTECDRALVLARQRWKELRQELKSLAAERQQLIEAKDWDRLVIANKREKRVKTGQTWALNILAAAGTRRDAHWLLANCPTSGTQKPLIDNVLQHIAHLEAKTGTLASGVLFAATESDKEVVAILAACVLHQWGYRAADERLLDYVLSGKDSWLLGRCVGALVDRGDARVLEVMRRVVQEHLRSMNDSGKSIYVAASQDAASYLLAYGTSADWRRATKSEFDMASRWKDLVYLLEDPREYVEAYLGVRHGGGAQFRYLELAEVLPALRELPPELGQQYRQDFEDTLVRAAIMKPIINMPPRECAIWARMHYHPAISCVWPNRHAAEVVMKQFRLRTAHSWIPRPWRQKKLVEDFASGGEVGRLLDYVPHDELIEGLRDVDQSDRPHRDLFLAYHRIATRAYVVDDPLPLGLERRAFVRRIPKYSGAVAGIVELRPDLGDGRLTLAVRLDAKAAYDGGFLPLPEEKAVFRRIEQCDLRELVDTIQLRSGDRVIDLALDGQSDGQFRYSTSLKQKDLSGLTIDLAMNFGDETILFTFDLFASEYALEMRRKSQQGGPDDSLVKAP